MNELYIIQSLESNVKCHSFDNFLDYKVSWIYKVYFSQKYLQFFHVV